MCIYINSYAYYIYRCVYINSYAYYIYIVYTYTKDFAKQFLRKIFAYNIYIYIYTHTHIYTYTHLRIRAHT